MNKGFATIAVTISVIALIVSGLVGVQLYQKSKLGGLVHIYQEMFPDGLIIGDRDKGQTESHILFTDSSNNFYIGTSTDANFSITAAGKPTIKNVVFATSTLNYSGNFSADTDTFYVKASNNRIGIGTTTPSYQVEIESATTPVLALTASAGNNDAQIRINNGYQNQEWLIFMDDSDSDKLKIATSTDDDILVITEDGDVTLISDLTVSEDFVLTGSITADTDTLILDATNNRVGIGTTTPSFTLEVDGKLYVDDAAKFTSTLETVGVATLASASITGAATVGTTLTVTGESNLDTLVQGGDVITVYGTTTLTAAQVCNSSVVRVGLLADAMADLTLPSAVALRADCLATAGDHKSLIVRDIASSTLALTIVKGAFIDLEGDDASADVLARFSSAELEFYYSDSATTTCVIRPFLDVD